MRRHHLPLKKMATWSGLSYNDIVSRAQAHWAIRQDDLPRLRLAVQLILASGHMVALDMLEMILQQLPQDPTENSAFAQLVANMMLLLSR